MHNLSLKHNIIYYHINLDFACGNTSAIRTGTTTGGNGTATESLEPTKKQKQKHTKYLKNIQRGWERVRVGLEERSPKGIYCLQNRELGATRLCRSSLVPLWLLLQ